MSTNNKKLANKIENSISLFLLLKGLENSVNHTNGVDLILLNSQKSIEVKSFLTYRYKNKQTGTIKKGTVKIRKEQLESDFYVCIQKHNQKNNLNYVSKLSIFCFENKDLKNFLFEQKPLYLSNLKKKDLYLTQKHLSLIKKFDLQELVNKLKKELILP